MNRKKRTSSARARVERRTVGFDAAGHIDPVEVNRLRELGGRSGGGHSDEAFTEATSDDFAEELGEAAVHHMTTGADELSVDLEAEVEEELGGPFVVTSGNVEFAGGTDESNIETATREPFPTT